MNLLNLNFIEKEKKKNKTCNKVDLKRKLAKFHINKNHFLFYISFELLKLNLYGMLPFFPTMFKTVICSDMYRL